MPSNENDASTSTNLENCIGVEFFSQIESKIRTCIPNSLRLIFEQCDITSAVLFSRLNDNYIANIKEFVRNELAIEMLPENRNLAEYLGTYRDCQNKFRFSTGQKMMIKMITEVCVKELNDNANEPNEPIGTTSLNQSETKIHR